MHPFRLAIAKPCQQDWNSMTGTEKRRHCSSCDHEVVALAEMTPEDAVALVRSARPHSLCLRIEHDDDGTVMFRQSASRLNASPLLMLTIGASMLLTACGDSAPPANVQNDPKSVATQSVNQVKNADHVDHVDHVNHVKPIATDSTAAHKPADAMGPHEKTIDAVVPTVASAAANPRAERTDDQASKSAPKPKTRVTTGCACAVGDTLCDCL